MFIELYGKAFELRRSNNFGRIFALLNLRGRSEKQGLDQKDIFAYLNRNFRKQKVSASTISRTLKKMEKSKYCNSTPSSGHGRRKYFTEVSIKQLTLERVETNVEEGRQLAKRLEELKKNITAEELSSNPNLLKVIENFEIIHRVLMVHYQEIYDKISKELNDY